MPAAQGLQQGFVISLPEIISHAVKERQGPMITVDVKQKICCGNNAAAAAAHDLIRRQHLVSAIAFAAVGKDDSGVLVLQLYHHQNS